MHELHHLFSDVISYLQEEHHDDFVFCSSEDLRYLDRIKEPKQEPVAAFQMPPPPVPKFTPPEKKAAPPAEVKPVLKEERKEETILFSSHFKEYQTLIAKLFPHFVTHEKILDDGIAKKISTRHRVQVKPVVLLNFSSDEMTKQFFENLSNAITKHLKEALIIDGRTLDKENLWDILLTSSEVKWILCEKEMLKKITHTNIPVIHLESAAVYLSNVEKKRELWKELCLKLKTP